MKHTNFEFKSKTKHLEYLEEKLLKLNPKFIGEDRQTDTYFKVKKGRLKLREGNIENALIYYERSNSLHARQSDVILYDHHPSTSLKKILIKVHGVLVIVKKVRKIYFVQNVKFHFDSIEGLGTFIEVEAIDKTGQLTLTSLKEQCQKYARFFEIKEEDYISHSYSDLMLQRLS